MKVSTVHKKDGSQLHFMMWTWVWMKYKKGKEWRLTSISYSFIQSPTGRQGGAYRQGICTATQHTLGCHVWQTQPREAQESELSQLLIRASATGALSLTLVSYVESHCSQIQHLPRWGAGWGLFLEATPLVQTPSLSAGSPHSIWEWRPWEHIPSSWA